jgi:hypothetical protein
MRHEYHLVLDDAIADLNAVLRPRFAVMDATVGLEGNGPKSGNPRVADRVLASADLVALDAVQAATMGIEPASVAHLGRCASRGLGTSSLVDVDVRGLDPSRDRVPFRVAKHNAVSLVENLLRRSQWKPLFFNTPLFKVCLLGAKVYYRLWTARHARRCWDEVLAHPFYGPLWSAALREGRPGAPASAAATAAALR